MNFNTFRAAVASQFVRMQKYPLFQVDIDKDEIWATYLSAFPDGSNSIFRERTEHDCSCCKQFIRTVGGVVAVIDGKLASIWDVMLTDEPAYQAVADAMSKQIKSEPIANAFLHFERTAGTEKNFEQLTEGVKTWTHFFVNIDRRFVESKDRIPEKLGVARDNAQVLKRSLTEITDDAVDTVLELIAQNSLYRGAEHKFAVNRLRELKIQSAGMSSADYDKFVWTASIDLPQSVARIRNTSIGTLLTNLSEGMDLEGAVRAFETMVAPANYKRPVALVTKGMIEKAKKKIDELGLLSALERRLATMSDITVNNVVFANRQTKGGAALSGNVFDELAASVGDRFQKTLPAVDNIPIENFITNILPSAESIEVLFENRHEPNLVSLVAPADPTAGKLFKWDNNFSWSYNGEVADSIKERVKAAGGNVTGDLCCRVAWDNSDDLDMHLALPDGSQIYYSKRRSCNGRLDVDANGMDGIRPNPVENIFWDHRSQIPEGRFQFIVHQYSRRLDVDEKGFDAEIDFMGTVHRFTFPRRLKQGEQVPVAVFDYTHKEGLKIVQSLPSTTASRTMWGLPTQTFHKVNVLMLSPNYWDGQQGVGNKHYFFMLDGCVNDGTVRGFYNEFLDSRLDPHRKVFEMVASKVLSLTPHQLSGLGFSSTQKNTLPCRVKGKFTRLINLVF